MSLPSRPHPAVADGQYHPIQVRLVPPIRNASLQARRGYFAPPPLPPSATLPARLDQAMRGTDNQHGVAAAMSDSARNGVVSVTVRFDFGHLAVPTVRGRRAQKLLVIAGLFDDQGRFISGRRGALDLDLSSSTYRRFVSHGLNANLALTAPPGTYHLRAVVGEASTGRITTFDRQVQVR